MLSCKHPHDLLCLVFKLCHPIPFLCYPSYSSVPLTSQSRPCPVLTPMISFISFCSIVPSPLISYIAKAHSSFCSGFPADVMLIASRNSLKSILPLLSASNVRNTCSQNFSALPSGKKLAYTSRNFERVNWPFGQSRWNTQRYEDC